jgi:hypothetical protein
MFTVGPSFILGLDLMLLLLRHNRRGGGVS